MKKGLTIIYKITGETVNTVKAKVPLELREISFHEIRTLIPQIREMNEDKFIQFENRMTQREDRCFVAWTDGIPVHYIWVRIKGSMHSSSAGVVFPLTDNMAWFLDARTSDKFKGKGIYPEVFSRISKALISENRRVYCDVSSQNKASLRGIHKTGFFRVMKIYRLGRFKVRFPGKLR
jgi:hypothetical protein